MLSVQSWGDKRLINLHRQVGLGPGAQEKESQWWSGIQQCVPGKGSFSMNTVCNALEVTAETMRMQIYAIMRYND